MRKILLAFATIGLVATGQAQKKTDNAEVNWGPELNEKVDGDFLFNIEETKDAVYQRMQLKKDQYLRKMDLNMKVLYNKPIDLEQDKKEMELDQVMLLGEKIAVFTEFYDKKNDEASLYVRLYNEADFSPLGQPRKVAHFHSEKDPDKGRSTRLASGNYSYEVGGFAIRRSEDKDRIIVTATELGEKGEKSKRTVTEFDNDMNELSAGPALANDLPEGYEVDRTYRTPDEALIYVCRKYPEKRERRALKREEKPDFEYHLVVFDAKGSAPADYPVRIGDKFMQDLRLEMGETGDIICCGFYGNKGTWSMRGVFFLRLDRNSKQIVHESYKEFDESFITAYMTEKEEKKAKKKAEKKDEELELPYYDIGAIVLRDDGGVVMMAEQYKQYQVCYTDSRGNTYCRDHYEYNDVLAINVDPQGNIEWAVKVPKRQHSVSDGGYYSSYALEVKGDKIYLIFNDSGENLFLKKGDKVKQFELTGDDAMVTIATIDGDGNVQREALFTPDRKGVILKPKDCVELDNDQMLIYATRKKEYRFGLITFK